MDIKCIQCGEPWEAWSVEEDFHKWQKELFMQGAGCPGCKGDPAHPYVPHHLDNLPEDVHPMILAQALAREKCTVPKWEEPPPPEPVRGNVYEAADGDEVMYLNADEEELADGGYFSYSDLHGEKAHWRNNAEVVVPRYLSGSDYSGGLVCKSNYRVFMEEFGDVEGVYEIHGGYYSYGIAILASVDNDEIADCLNSLHDYPLISEDDHSDLKYEAEEEAWENWAQSDFIHALEKRFNLEDIEFSDDLHVSELFRYAAEKKNEYWEDSECEGVYIRIDTVVEGIECKVVENTSCDGRSLIALYVDSKYEPYETVVTAVITK